jgi:hypothetical protein
MVHYSEDLPQMDTPLETGRRVRVTIVALWNKVLRQFYRQTTHQANATIQTPTHRHVSRRFHTLCTFAVNGKQLTNVQIKI